MEFRFPPGRIVSELLLVGVAFFILALVAHEALRFTAYAGLHSPAAWGAFALTAGALLVFRWRSRIRIDRDAIELRRSRRAVDVRLEWEEIDEVFLLGPERFEVRGAGKAVVFRGAFPDAARARQRVSARLGGLRDRLRDRALMDGALEFRMPIGRWQAHASYLLAILVLTALTSMVLAPFLAHRRIGFPVFIVLIGGSWIWSLRRRASRLGTRVTLYKDGLLVRRLDGKDRVAWSEIASTEWDEKGGLVLVRRSGGRIAIPPTLANIAILEEFVEEGRQAASARS